VTTLRMLFPLYAFVMVVLVSTVPAASILAMTRGVVAVEVPTMPVVPGWAS
jgi:hypothetical protein